MLSDISDVTPQQVTILINPILLIWVIATFLILTRIRKEYARQIRRLSTACIVALVGLRFLLFGIIERSPSKMVLFIVLGYGSAVVLRSLTSKWRVAQ